MAANPREEKYEALTKAVREAGFYTNGVQIQGEWDRTCICSKRMPGGYGYTGNSFWVSKTSSGWFLGSWSGNVYRMADESRLAELCISWLRRVPDETKADFDDQLKTEFVLVQLPEEELDKLIP